MMVLLPVRIGSSLVSVMVEFAIVFENVMVVPACVLAYAMASRSVGLPTPLTVSALLVTTQLVLAHCAAASVAGNRAVSAVPASRQATRRACPYAPLDTRFPT